MSNTITIQGLVATTPRHIVTQQGLPITSFRVASSDRKFDHERNVWLDGETNWFTVTSFKQLAINSAGSIRKGDRVIVSGLLKIRDWDNGERAGTSVELEAESIGHDLAWGTSTFTRTVSVQEAPVPEPVAESSVVVNEPYRDERGNMVDGVPHSCSCNRCGN